MAVFLDARIPVAFGTEPGPADAVLVLEDGPAHVAGCACCVVRTPNASALDRLFLARVKGEVPWFTRVVVAREDPALRAAVQDDPVLSARFRLEEIGAAR